MPVIEVTETSKFNEIIKSTKKTHVFVDFYATWCGPCKRIAPRIEEYSNIYNGIEFLKVDVDEQDINEIVNKYDVNSLPTFMIFKAKDMKPLYNPIVGADQNKIENMLKLVTGKVAIRNDF